MGRVRLSRCRMRRRTGTEGEEWCIRWREKRKREEEGWDEEWMNQIGPAAGGEDERSGGTRLPGGKGMRASKMLLPHRR